MRGSYRKQGTCGVYALIDPRTKELRYVGGSANIEARYKSHVSGSDTPPKRKAWVFELRAAGLKPELVVLAACPPERLKELERAHLDRQKRLGHADLNTHLRITDGRTKAAIIAENEELKRRLQLAICNKSQVNYCPICPNLPRGA